MVVTRRAGERGKGKEGKVGQVHGDGRRLEFGW